METNASLSCSKETADGPYNVPHGAVLFLISYFFNIHFNLQTSLHIDLEIFR
jgi:hypothetical protein